MQVMEGHCWRPEWKRLCAPSSGKAIERLSLSGRERSSRINRGMAERSLWVSLWVERRKKRRGGGRRRGEGGREGKRGEERRRGGKREERTELKLGEHHPPLFTYKHTLVWPGHWNKTALVDCVCQRWKSGWGLVQPGGSLTTWWLVTVYVCVCVCVCRWVGVYVCVCVWGIKICTVCSQAVCCSSFNGSYLLLAVWLTRRQPGKLSHVNMI